MVASKRTKTFIVVGIAVWISIVAFETIFVSRMSDEVREIIAYSQIIPILVAAFYFGQAGGLLVALIASLVSGSIIISNIENVDTLFVQRLMFQVIAFNSVALVTSFLSEQEKNSSKKLVRQVERLSALRAIDKAIISGAELSSTLYVLLESLTRLLEIEAASILLFNPKTKQLELKASLGFLGEYPNPTPINIGAGLAGQAAQELTTIFQHDVAQYNQHIPQVVKGISEIDYYAVPLVANNYLYGVLEVYDRSSAPDAEWKNYLETLAGQAAIAIAQSTLLDDLKNANEELSEAYQATLLSWSRALNLRDKETDNHTQRVVELSVKLAQQMGLDEEQLQQFQRGAILHDIGKMGIPDEILLKPASLSDDEWFIMRKHPVYAQILISPIKYLQPALAIPYYHHERWDGKGYPFGLKGTEIPLEARIFAVVDVWDALCSDRPYRKALSEVEALKYIQEQSGKHFDPDVVTEFLNMLQKKTTHHAVS